MSRLLRTLFLIGTLVLSLGASTPPGAQVAAFYSHSAASGSPMAWQAKVAPQVLEQAANGPAEFLVVLKAQANLSGAQDLPNTEEEMRQLLAQWKRDQVTLHVRFDSNNDGVITIDEWAKARQAARREVLKAQRERVSGSAFNVLRKPKDDHFPYLLSVLPQDELVRRYRWFAGGGLALFLLAGAICSWLLAVRVTH